MGVPYAYYEDVIEWNAVKELCPAEAQALKVVLEKHQIDEKDFARGFGPDRDLDDFHEMVADMFGAGVGTADQSGSDAAAERAVAEVEAAWDALRDAFKNTTRVGNSYLTLNIDCDPAEGVFYYVLDPYQLTPAGEKFKDKFDRQMFVNHF
jgi:hypothetical protein